MLGFIAIKVAAKHRMAKCSKQSSTCKGQTGEKQLVTKKLHMLKSSLDRNSDGLANRRGLSFRSSKTKKRS